MTESQAEPLINLSEIAEIELFILKRMKDFTLGDHASVFKGSGVSFVGLRDWEPGDRLSRSNGRNVNHELQPDFTREFDIPSLFADDHRRCGRLPVGAAVCTCLTAGHWRSGGRWLAAVVLSGHFGMMAFDEGFLRSQRRGRASANRTCFTVSICINAEARLTDRPF